MAMTIDVEHLGGSPSVSVVALDGELDASNYEKVIEIVRDAYARGTRGLVLDLSKLTFMASSGLFALHSALRIMRGETPPDPEAGWQAFHSIDHARAGGVQQQAKLLSPQPKVGRTLQMTSMDDFFEIYTDKQVAIASF